MSWEDLLTHINIMPKAFKLPVLPTIPESNDYTLYRLFDFEAKGRQYVFWAGFSLGMELFKALPTKW